MECLNFIHQISIINAEKHKTAEENQNKSENSPEKSSEKTLTVYLSHQPVRL